MRIQNIEARYSKLNKKYELVQWRDNDSLDGECCCVIAFFDRHSEGYDMRTVGARYHNAPMIAHVLASHTLNLLNELFADEQMQNELEGAE